MASVRMLGIDIGNYRLKLSVNVNHRLKSFYQVKLPDRIVQDSEIVSWEAMGDFIRETVKAAGISCKNAAVMLPIDSTYIRRVKMPLMTVNQLKINLPYEFHDYITEEMDKYVYDYAVIAKTDREMELIAVAAEKDLIEKYETMCRRAGLRLKILAPDVVAFRNILRDYEKRHSIPHGTKDYAILDLGDHAIQLHFFTRGEYEITRSMEPGCRAIAEKIAELTGHEEHIVKLHTEAGEAYGSSLAEQEEVQDLYSGMAIQIMRVLNFYSFNNPNNTIDALYYCGGGANISMLMEAIASNTGIEMKGMTELVQLETDDPNSMMASPQSFGITMG